MRPVHEVKGPPARPRCQEDFIMDTDRRLVAARVTPPDYERLICRARQERAEALRAAFFKVGRALKQLGGALRPARQHLTQASRWANARF